MGLSAVTCLLEVSGALAGEDCEVVEASAEVLGVADGDESLLPLLLSGALDHRERWRETERLSVVENHFRRKHAQTHKESKRPMVCL